MSFTEDPAKFIASDATVADKIRALDAAGYSRAEIARMLHKRYQHVRNVLEADKLKGAPWVAPAASLRSTPGSSSEMRRIGEIYRLPIGPGGVVRLPDDIMTDFGLREGGVLIAERNGAVLEVLASGEGLRRAREIIPQWKPGEPLWSEALIEERRREAAREEADG